MKMTITTAEVRLIQLDWKEFQGHPIGNPWSYIIPEGETLSKIVHDSLSRRDENR